MFIPAFARIKSSCRLFCLLMLTVNGIDGAYPAPGLNVEATELLGKSGGYIRICY